MAWVDEVVKWKGLQMRHLRPARCWVDGESHNRCSIRGGKVGAKVERAIEGEHLREAEPC